MFYTLTYKIFDFLTDTLKGLNQKIFLQNRPSAVDEKMQSFLVVSLPGRLETDIHGGEMIQNRTTGVIYAFYRGKSDGTPNIVGQTTLDGNVMSLFPMKGECVECVRPELLNRGFDDLGFHVSAIYFDIRVRRESEN